MVFLDKPLDLYRDTLYNNCIAIKVEVSIIADKSRAEYFRKRRENQKTFSVTVDRTKLEQFEKRLSETNQTKTDWINRRIDEELSKQK